MNTTNKPEIGFIGLGLMGSAMAKRLHSLGYPVTVIAHRNRQPIEEAVSLGMTEVTSVSTIAEKCDFILLCVDTTTAVESIMTGSEGVINHIKKGALVIDFGTSIPGSTRKLAAACIEAGASMMDAPLGRTPAHAKDGLLNIMAAGNEEDFKRASPVFKDLGENIFHVGPIGAGHTLKLINNFFAMTTASAMSEAFALADLAQLDRNTLYQVMSSGPLHSGMMDFIKDSAVDNKKDSLAFTITNGHKDVGYYTQMAEDLAAPSLISPSILKAFELATKHEQGDRYISEMVDIIAATHTKKPA